MLVFRFLFRPVGKDLNREGIATTTLKNLFLYPLKPVGKDLNREGIATIHIVPPQLRLRRLVGKDLNREGIATQLRLSGNGNFVPLLEKT